MYDFSLAHLVLLVELKNGIPTPQRPLSAKSLFVSNMEFILTSKILVQRKIVIINQQPHLFHA